MIFLSRLDGPQAFSAPGGNKYRVVQQLGIGGNSEVFLVEATNGEWRGCLFALKVFVNIADNVRLQRFQQEVQFLKICDHPAILKTFDSGEYSQTEGGTQLKYPFLVTEYLPKTLRASMMEGLPIAEKLAFSLQLLSALRYLATRPTPICHRDIKPENIFVTGKSCVLGDFGLITPGTGEDPSADYKVEPSTGIRFPRMYPTPDLVDYCKSNNAAPVITPKSDVFQLGLVLAELFSGTLPLEERKKPLDAVVLKPIGEVPGSQGARIRQDILRMLELDASKRPGAEDLYDPWNGAFREVCTLCSQLEGRVF